MFVRWFRSSLRARLLITYLLVIGAGALVLLLTTGLVAPSFYDVQIRSMMGQGQVTGGVGGMMGQAGQSGQVGQGGMMQASADALRQAYNQAMTQSVLAGVAASLIVAVILSLFVSDRLASPIRRMATAARRIAAGHYAERVPLPTSSLSALSSATGTGASYASTDEIGHLAASFNDMAASLEDTERRRVELLGDVAHELRTPVNTLQGYLEGLLDGVIQPTPELWAKMHGEAGRMQTLVNDLRDLSRAEARQLSLKVEPLAPATIAQAAVEGMRLPYAEKGLDLDVQIPQGPQGLPGVLVDRDRAVQVLTNLLSNALRYTLAPGTVTVTVSASASASANQPGGWRDVLFQVQDTGIGISEADLPHLFERFYRVDKSRSRAVGGSGIGLTIARALVEAMGGRIWAESPGPGKGSTFSFTLPAAC